MSCKVCKRTPNHPFVSLFRFPKEPNRCEMWAKILNLAQEYEMIGAMGFYKSYRICSDHFKQTFVRYVNNKRRLLFNAVPDPYVPVLKVKVDLTDEETDHRSAQRIEEMLLREENEFQMEMWDQLCRLCVQLRTNMIPIFGEKGKDLDLPSKIKDIPFEIKEDDILPTTICENCLTELEQHYEFFNKCKETETKYNELILKHKIQKVVECNPTADVVEGDCERHLKNTKAERNLKSVDFNNSFSLRHDYSNMWIKNTRHMQNDWKCGKIYDCDECSRSFETLELTEAHKKCHRLVPRKNGRFVCELCDMIYPTRTKLAEHLRGHNGETPYSCSHCSMRFHKLSLLKQHIAIHFPHQFQCKICKKLFRRKSKLVTHVKKHDLRRKKFNSTKSLSSECSATATQIRETATCFEVIEIPATEGTKEVQKTKSVRVRKEGQTLLCAHCGETFSRLDVLKIHTRVHTGERPFSCRFCGFVFKQKGDCNKHEANHSNDMTTTINIQ